MQDRLLSRRSFPWPIPILPAADGDQAGPHGQAQDSRRRPIEWPTFSSGVTNTITALKNAQLAQSLLVLR